MRIPGRVRAGADFSYETAYFSDVLDRPQNIIGAQGYSDAFLSYSTADGHWTASVNGHNLADRRAFQSLSYAGSKNSWEGPVSPPRTVFFKIAYVL